MAKQFTFGGETFDLLTIADLTFAEGRAIQKATGAKVGEFSGDDAGVVQGLLWVSMKRRKPELRFADLDDVPMSAIGEPDEEDEDEPDPTEGEENSPTSD